MGVQQVRGGHIVMAQRNLDVLPAGEAPQSAPWQRKCFQRFSRHEKIRKAFLTCIYTYIHLFINIYIYIMKIWKMKPLYVSD